MARFCQFRVFLEFMTKTRPILRGNASVLFITEQSYAYIFFLLQVHPVCAVPIC